MPARKLIVLLCGLLTGCSVVMKPIAGSSSKDPSLMKSKMSRPARDLVDRAFEGINLSCLEDHHVHSVGMGAGGTGAWVNPKMLSPTHPYKFIQYQAYMSASGIKSVEHADQEYMKRLLALANADPRYGKLHMLAFDHHHSDNGDKLKDHSTFYLPNKYVYQLYEQYPDKIVPVISVHPYRKDAVEELEKWGKKGVRKIKWLPNAMRIDPSDVSDDFYRTMIKYDMAILTHTGHEKAVEGEEYQKLGNPLLLKKPLDMGVKVIMAHMASLGECSDLENDNKSVSCFSLSWRLMQNKKYEKNLFGEISALTLYTRVGEPIDTVLGHPEYHHRLVNGSDYPLPAINILFRTSQLQKLGYISQAEKNLLNEIFDYNPLLFDFVLKRTLHHPKTGQKFLPVTFETPEALGCKKSD